MDFRTRKNAIALCVPLCTFPALVHGQSGLQSGWSWTPELPPRVPRVVDTNGNVESIDIHFTTHVYEDEAGRLMIQEANHAAQALNLKDDLSKDAQVRAVPFGLSYGRGMLGSVTTPNYAYRFLDAGKLDRIEIHNSYEVWRSYQNVLVPENQADNQAAYELATQWLSALSVDVKGLNHDFQLSVASSPVANHVGGGNEPTRRLFAPTYDVVWGTSNGPAAFVQLYLPDKLLIQLGVQDPKYNLRPPIILTNLAALFPGQAIITTNYPVSPSAVVYSMGPPDYEVTFVTDSNQPEPAFHGIPLSRWIQTQTRLNTNQLSLSQLMTLKPVSGPDERGVTAFELPIPFDALSSGQPIPCGIMDFGFIDANGNFTEATLTGKEKAPDGNTRLLWNINWDSPGWHQIRARMIYEHGMDGDEFNLIGPALPYYSSNACRFFGATSLFSSEGADLYAQLREPTAKFRIKVTDLKGRLVNDLSGDTTNGFISLAWDLTGLDGNKYTGNSFNAYFYITYPDDTGTNYPVRDRLNKIGTRGD